MNQDSNMKKHSSQHHHPTERKEASSPEGDLQAESGSSTTEEPLADMENPGAETVPVPSEPEAEADEAALLRDQLLRLQADFDNYRKRIDRERKDWALYANEKLLKDLLPALDNFELGLANGVKSNAPEALLEGLRLVHGQIEGALAKSGVTPIDAEGCPFDPHLHEAITHMPSQDVPAGTVMAQTRRGYKMGDKLLRAAQVVVSSGTPD